MTVSGADAAALAAARNLDPDEVARLLALAEREGLAAAAEATGLPLGLAYRLAAGADTDAR